MTSLKPTVYPLKKRQSEISRKLDAHDKKSFHNVYLRGEIKSIPIINLDKDIPIYRMMNGRTRSQQLSYIKKKKHKSDFFSSNIENQEQLNLQHEFLFNLASDPNANLYTEFKKKKEFDKTHDPLLITLDGVVINGNRRLSTVRELYNENPSTFSNFQSIPCAVLNLKDLTELDIEEIENRLQLKNPLKLDYSWINELLKIKYQIDLKLKNVPKNQEVRKSTIYAEVGASMGISKPKDIEAKLSILALAHQYLEETKQEGNYEVIKNMEQIFYNFSKNLDKLTIEGGAQNSAGNKMAIAIIRQTQKNIFNERSYSFRTLLEPNRLLETCEHTLVKLGGGKSIDNIYRENAPSKKNLLGKVIKSSNDLTREDKFRIINKEISKLDIDDKRFAGVLRNIKNSFDMKKDQDKFIRNIEDALATLEFIKKEYRSSIDEKNKSKIKRYISKIIKISQDINNL